MNEYELLYIVSPRVPADDVANSIERVTALITASGGEVLTTDNWGRRRLAYPIRQYFEGTYVLCTLKMPPAGAPALEAALGLSEEIIRHLLIAGIIPRTSGGRARDDRDRGFDGSSSRDELPADDMPMADTPLDDESVEDADDMVAAPEPEPAAAE